MENVSLIMNKDQQQYRLPEIILAFYLIVHKI